MEIGSNLPVAGIHFQYDLVELMLAPECKETVNMIVAVINVLIQV